DDDPGGDARGAAAGGRLRRGRRAAPAARHLDRRRAPGQPDADALHDAGDLPLSRPVPAMGAAPPPRRRAPAATRGMTDLLLALTAPLPSGGRGKGPIAT